MLFWVLLALTLILFVGFLWGQPKNLRLARQAMVTLEEIFTPQDVEYTWLGGVLGFKALYRRSAPIPEFLVTLLLLPRHTWLYMPFAYLRAKGDRLLFAFPRTSTTERVPPALPNLRQKILPDRVVLELRIRWPTLRSDLQEIARWLASS